MFLDDPKVFRSLDRQDMLAEIDGLPEQLKTAWDLGQALDAPPGGDLDAIVIAGMGGSAIGADLLAAYAAALCPIPVVVHRDYDLPAWANGPRTLLIACSHSGNTEETLSSFQAGVERGTGLFAITTGGELAAAAGQEGAVVWRFEHAGQPRAAVGYSFGLLLAAFARLGLVPDPSSELRGAVGAMQAQQDSLRGEVPAVHNLAKRVAGQFMGRWVSVFGSDALAPVARRWKGQISEIAKAWAQFEYLPESDHNTLAGLFHPEELFPRTMMVFLQSASDHPRNRLRSELTRKAFMLQGLNTDFIQAQGESRLAHQWTTLHLGDYSAYFLAMAYGVDPTPVEAIENFKQDLQERAGR